MVTTRLSWAIRVCESAPAAHLGGATILVRRHCALPLPGAYLLTLSLLPADALAAPRRGARQRPDTPHETALSPGADARRCPGRGAARSPSATGGAAGAGGHRRPDRGRPG